jgi:hypothetical protein
MKLDISIALDDAIYLTPQVYLLIESLKDKIPEDTTLHLTTTGNREVLVDFISKHIRTKHYIKSSISELKSRCSYLMRTMEIESDADYVLKTDLDMLFLNKFDELFRMLKDEPDILIQSENRRVIQDDSLEWRLWRTIYKAMGFQMPCFKIHYIENHELGLPLFNTGAFVIKTDKMKELSKDWIRLTKICEKWIQYNVHPNEQAATAMILDKKWKWIGMSEWIHFNPIAHYRSGEFPSQELVEDCKIPEEVFLLHYHKPNWLQHLSKYNETVQQTINLVKLNIPDEWWNLSLETYMEKN